MGSLVGRSVLRVRFWEAWKRAACAPSVSSAMAQRRRRQALRTNSAAVTSSTGSAGARVFQSAAQKFSYSSFSSGWTQLLVAKSPNLVLLREDFALPSVVWGPEESLAFSRSALIWDSGA